MLINSYMHSVREYKEIQEFKRSNKIFILHFVTPWCSPCKLSKKLIQTELNAVVGKAIVFDINCDEAEELLLKYKIVGVPTIVVLNKNMSIHSKIVGYLPQKTKALFKQLKNQ